MEDMPKHEVLTSEFISFSYYEAKYTEGIWTTRNFEVVQRNSQEDDFLKLGMFT